ncbi:integrator complex subunit 6 [Anaeramoeba flamelloides]|uniref:Integrator complex subunit 6 n=1 Tax=Anaeramoeba flamelloides TaxID=1746091 RepID=A0ABQ8XWK6_9EUKA|nr:integrator complex subunit 6 [Anaeramoeba flamelloides]
MNIVFAIDTSSSMNQTISSGITLIDCVKAAIEYFVKLRVESQHYKGDRYFLVTSSEDNSGKKVTWSTPYSSFLEEVKHLKATDMTNINSLFLHSFEILNKFRFLTQCDNFGNGYCPWMSETGVVIFFTDGGMISDFNKTKEHVKIPSSKEAGFELSLEPFRWDQRVYTISLEISGLNSPNSKIDIENKNKLNIKQNPVFVMSDITAGKVFVADSLRNLLHIMDNIQKNYLRSWVTVNFEPIPKVHQQQQQMNMYNNNLQINNETRNHLQYNNNMNNENNNETGQRQIPKLHYTLLIVKNRNGNWPIPEQHWLKPNFLNLPQRQSQPLIWIDQDPCEHSVIPNFPIDSYELAPSTLTEYFLSFNNPKLCWKVYTPRIGENNTQMIGRTFGFIKQSTEKPVIKIYILPYNWPVLFRLLRNLNTTNISQRITFNNWKREFEQYLLNIPFYYIIPLNNYLNNIGRSNMISDQFIRKYGRPNPTISKYLIRLKHQAKQENEKIQNSLNEFNQQNNRKHFQENSRNNSSSKNSFSNFQLLDKRDGLQSNIKLKMDNYQKFNFNNKLTNDNFENNINFNPFDIGKENLESEFLKIKSRWFNFSNKNEVDQKFKVKISEMGNYSHEMRKRQTLRPFDEKEEEKMLNNKNKNFFGNPFKQGWDEGLDTEIDEMNEARNVQQQYQNRSTKRKSRKSTKKKRRPLSERFLDLDDDEIIFDKKNNSNNNKNMLIENNNEKNDNSSSSKLSTPSLASLQTNSSLFPSSSSSSSSSSPSSSSSISSSSLLNSQDAWDLNSALKIKNENLIIKKKCFQLIKKLKKDQNHLIIEQIKKLKGPKWNLERLIKDILDMAQNWKKYSLVDELEKKLI